MIQLILSILFSLTSAAGMVDHAIYISVAEINYSSASAESKIEVKVFTDDLQNVLRNFSDQYVRTVPGEVLTANRSLTESYFNEKLKLLVNGEKAEMKLTGGREENDAHFLLFSMQTSSSWKKLEIQGDYFSEVFPDQSNVFTIRGNGKKYFARLTKSNPKYTITFD